MRGGATDVDAAPDTTLKPLLTLAQAFAANDRLIVWCKSCQHRFEPDTVWADRAARCSNDGAGPGKAAALLAMRRPRCGLCRQRHRALIRRPSNPRLRARSAVAAKNRHRD
jgi:hypothetical protein